jgi:hypothetical protein
LVKSVAVPLPPGATAMLRLYLEVPSQPTIPAIKASIIKKILTLTRYWSVLELTIFIFRLHIFV